MNIFDDIRNNLDYSWHIKLNDYQNKYHNKILCEILKSQEKTFNGIACFTAGCMGAGKSHYIKQHSLFREFIHNDPDQLKGYILQYEPKLTRQNKILHLFSCNLSEVLLRYCIMQHLSFVLDGTLRNIPWHKSLFEELKSKDFLIHLIYVKSSLKTILIRAAKRHVETKRHVPLHLILQTFRSIHISVECLKPYSDTFVTFLND